MATVLILRHGTSLTMMEKSTSFLLHDDENGLTDQSKLDAKQLAEHVKASGLAFELHASPVRRAKETAEIIAEVLGKGITYDDRLREHSFGSAEITVADSRELQMQSHAHPFDVIYGDESKFEHLQRVKSWFLNFTAKLDLLSNYIIVTHGGTIDHLMATIMGSNVENMTRYHIACKPLHFHQWDVREESDHRIWRLDGVNLLDSHPSQ